NELAHDLVELTAALYLTARHGLPADERAGPLLGLQHPANSQLAVRTHHRIGIDREVHGQLPHGGQLSAGDQRSGCDPPQHLVDDLTVDRHSAGEIESKLNTLSVGSADLI